MTFLDLTILLEKLTGVGPRVLTKLKKLGLLTVKDLVWHFPFRYEDWQKISKIKDLIVNQEATVCAEIKTIAVRRVWRGRFITEAIVSDETSSISVTWFNQPYLKQTLKSGMLINLSGKVSSKKGKIYLAHPAYEIITPALKETEHTARIVPVYPETRGLTSKYLRHLIKTILDNLPELQDPIPLNILQENNLPEINIALKNIHFPEKIKDTRQAKKRFAFEDLFFLQLYNLQQKLKLKKEKAPEINLNLERIKEIVKTLPFELTLSQKKSLWEILKDLTKPHPMNRLLQGDVGSGKTIVAAIAALCVAENNWQTAFMAPTEILASQHYKTINKFFPEFEGGIGLLTSGEAKICYGRGLETEIKKPRFVEKISRNEIKIIIGTHALIQKNIVFPDLALVIVDEQHRFGVQQRAELLKRDPKTTITDPKLRIHPNLQKEAKLEDKIIEKDLSYKLVGIFFKIQEKLGRFCRERQYADVLEKKLEEEQINFKREYPIEIGDRKSNFIDFVIENRILIDLKAKPFIEKNDYYQMKRYLEIANLELGLIVNFQDKYLKPKRILGNKKFVDSDRFVVSNRFIPHFLSMSATPIPRTLSLTIFSDLNLSLISELPKNRKPIITKIVSPLNREKAYQFIREQIKKGRQVFVICPRIDTDNTRINTDNLLQSDISINQSNPYKSVFETKAVKEEYEKLSQKVFPDLRVAMLHGKMPAKGGSAAGGKPTKESVMKNFSEGETDILVSTSVVEVGVDVPNATIMMIEGTEKFGLAQLYQFRGRVGRGQHQSFCFLFTDSETRTVQERLKAVVEAKNGFELAEKDLQIRGPGEFLGGAQTGLPDIAMKAIQNPDLVKNAREAAVNILSQDPNLKNYPILRDQLKKFQAQVHWE